MNKVKLVGWANGIVGVLNIALASIYFGGILPRTQLLYQDLDIIGPNPITTYLPAGLILLLGVVSLLLGYKLIKGLLGNYFYFGIVTLLLNLLVLGWVLLNLVASYPLNQPA